MAEHLPGFREFYPDPAPRPDSWSFDSRLWLFDRWRATARRYGFREYDGPPVEPLELYTAKSGAEIVGQLFNFTDKGDREVSLRPEMTPTVARMVASAERAYRKPIKWFSIPQLFRYEKQQRGRLREHFQLNCDIFGEPSLAADAELVALLIDTLRGCGLAPGDFVVRLSSRAAWQGFFRDRGGSADREYEFFQVIDKLEREKPEVAEARLATLGVPVAEVRAFIQRAEPTPELQTVLDDLKARGLADYTRIDYGVVRGLAYYTGVVFEAFDALGEFRAIAGGGRYDDLIGRLSGSKASMPALGFGMGDVVLTELLRSRGRLGTGAAGLDEFVLIEDESLRPEALAAIQRLRDAGRSVDYALAPSKSDKQFKRAADLGARHLVWIERDAAGAISARRRNVASRAESRTSLEEITANPPAAS